MAETHGSNADIAKSAQGGGVASSAGTRTEGVDPDTAEVVGGGSTRTRAPEPLKIKEQGMKAEAIAGEAAKQNQDVEDALDDGAKYIQAPYNTIQPGVMDPGKYVRNADLDRAVARDEESREGEGSKDGRDRFGRDSLGRVPRDEALSDELIDSLGAADLAAVAHDRGYTGVATHTGAGTTRAAFRKAQAADEGLKSDKRPVKKGTEA